MLKKRVRNNLLGIDQAKQYAFLLLKYRQRSCAEIKRRLERKKFSPEVIAQTIAFLREKNFLDDRLFAENWINWRLKQGVGYHRIRRELQQKGIENNLIEEVLKKVVKPSNNLEVLETLARQRLSRMRGLDEKTMRRRLFNFLMRRGFLQEEVIDCLERIFKEQKIYES
ncbi:MAG: recombination regulator RecX [Candidatus Omnitrophica bacterium]|nr:recombination regulator RecX [Candidatus Omnitrophota bacterium]